jgi:hypothetical protein
MMSDGEHGGEMQIECGDGEIMRQASKDGGYSFDFKLGLPLM